MSPMSLPLRRRAGRRARAFTLIEIVIALAILSVLVFMAMPVVHLEVQRQKETQLREALREIRNAIDAYKKATEDGRIARQAEASGYPPRLEDLVEGVVNARDPKGRPIYFLRRLPRDPMAPDSPLPASETWGRRSYDSPPDAPAEGADVFDVYSLAEGVGINGIEYRQW